MSLVYAGICCHAPGITSRSEMAPENLRNGLYDAYKRQSQAIKDSGAEAIVMVSSEHFANFFMDNMPSFSIGMAEEYHGPIEDPKWLKIDPVDVPGNPDMSLRIIKSVMKSVDVGFSQEWNFDHGMSVPLHFLTPKYDIPIIPVNINCQAPPMTPLHRSWDLGVALRKAIDELPEKVALIGTGGTSHWPCTPDSGKINEAWDRDFIDNIINKRKDTLLAYDDEQTYIDAGQGGGEMRTSICLAAATEEAKGEVWFMEPIPVWATCCTIANLI